MCLEIHPKKLKVAQLYFSRPRSRVRREKTRFVDKHRSAFPPSRRYHFEKPLPSASGGERAHLSARIWLQLLRSQRAADRNNVYTTAARGASYIVVIAAAAK